jgi:TPR repeat protein
MGYGSYEQLQEKVFSMFNNGNYNEAISMVTEAHEKGDSDATCILAGLYMFGLVFSEDTDKAIQLYEAALNSGNVYAAQMLGSLFEDGNEEKGIPANPEKAFRYYKRGADLGCPKSLGSLAHCYYWGTGTPEDNNKAFSCGIQAAKQGDVNGMIVAALCYDDGLGTLRDPYAAAHWYR